MISVQPPRLSPICYTDNTAIINSPGLRGFERCKIYFDPLLDLIGLGLLSRRLFGVIELWRFSAC